MHSRPDATLTLPSLLLLQGMGAVFFNKGENCIAAGRLFVEEAIHDEFVTRVVRHLQVCCEFYRSSLS